MESLRPALFEFPPFDSVGLILIHINVGSEASSAIAFRIPLPFLSCAFFLTSVASPAWLEIQQILSRPPDCDSSSSFLFFFESSSSRRTDLRQRTSPCVHRHHSISFDFSSSGVIMGWGSPIGDSFSLSLILDSVPSLRS